MFHSCKYNFPFCPPFAALLPRIEVGVLILPPSGVPPYSPLGTSASQSSKISRMTSERKNEMLSNDNVIPPGFYMEKALKIAKRSVKSASGKWATEALFVTRKNQHRLIVPNFNTRKIQYKIT